MSLLSRFLMFLFIGLAVGIAALWIAGGKREEYSEAIEIQRSPSQVFPFLVKPDSVKQWMNEIDYIDEPLPPKVDSYETPPKLTRIHKASDGTRTEFSDKVLRYKQDETLTVQSVNGGTTITSIVELEDSKKDSTFVRYDVLVSHGGLSRLMAPLQKTAFQDRMRQEIQKLKELVEKNTTLKVPEKKTDPDQVPGSSKPASASGVDVSGGS